MPKLVPKRPATEEEFLPTVRRLAALAEDFHAQDIKAYDVRGLSLLTDCFLMCNAASDRQLKAVRDGIRDGMKEIGVGPATSEGDAGSSWLLLDYGSVIVHIFRAEARGFYDLDGLWGDAESIDLNLDD